jgi:hypothetical protein
MNKMLIIAIMFSSYCLGQDLTATAKRTNIENVVYIDVTIANHSPENKYLQLSFWEVDGVIDSLDYLFGAADSDYIVNKISFWPKYLISKSLPCMPGDKGGFPRYKNYPLFALVPTNDSIKIEIELSRILSKAVENGEYIFGCDFPYINSKNFESLIKHFNISGKDILYSKKILVNITYEKTPYEWISSEKKIENIDNDFILRLFQNWVWTIVK